MQWAQKQKGFTIVELLIVVVVIAILAAITIVAYNGISNRAKASAAQSAASQAAKKVMAYAVENAELYPADLSELGIHDSGDTTYQYKVDNSTNPRTFCLTTTTKNISYYVSSEGAIPKAGGCQGHGQNGIAAITNLALNPRATSLSNSGLGRWAGDRWGADGTYSTISGIGDHPAGISTAVRFTVSTPKNSHGFHLANNPQLASPGGGAGWDALFPVTPESTYAISAWVRKSGDARNFAVYVHCAVDATAWSIAAGAYEKGTAVSAGFNQWVRASISYTVPANCVKISIMICQDYGTADNTGDTIDGTGLMIVESDTLHSFADGHTQNWAWNGAPNASTSTGPAL